MIARRNLVFIVAAVIVGLISIAFGIGVTVASSWFARMIAGRPWVPFILSPAGLAGIVFLTRNIFPGAQGSGIPQSMAGLQMQDAGDVDRVLSWRIAIGKILLTLLGFLVGASIGKEGPIVQIGCSVMNNLGRLGLERSHGLQRLLILAGGAAGITCAFNAPVAGIVFAIEEMARSFDERILRGLTLAAFVSGVTLFAVLGYHPYFGHSRSFLPFGYDWLAIPACGLLGGIAGGAFSRIITTPRRFLPGAIGNLALNRPVLFAALCGLVLACIGVLSQGKVYDASYPEAFAALHGSSLPPIGFGPLKWAATLVSYLSGIPGGIFAPSLAAGVGFGSLLVHIFPQLPLGALAMIGMAGYFSGVVQSPLTATIIVIEMTSNPAMTVPVGAAAFLGTAASRLICPQPVYHALSTQFLRVVEQNSESAAPSPVVTVP
ncbi:MAG TPA: chloride channel protein [Acetobacteraceae bacterium]|nr:chloride channel protein [Acetobacteraceae bacterium]